MAMKRQREEVSNFELIKEPHAGVTVHGVINFLSPVKPGRGGDYFDGSLTDGRLKLRLVVVHC